MSKSSHAKHEHKAHEHKHHVDTDAEIEAAVPSFATRHKTLIWIIIILFFIGAPLLFAALSILRFL